MMSRRLLGAFAASAGALLVVAAVQAAAGQAAAAPVFTAKQATDGRGAYMKDCASCHMPDLSGENEIAALVGPPFTGIWGTRSTKQLFDYISTAMPYGRPSLSVEAYTSILAYVLQANGAVAGESELTASTAVPINSLLPAAP